MATMRAAFFGISTVRNDGGTRPEHFVLVDKRGGFCAFRPQQCGGDKKAFACRGADTINGCRATTYNGCFLCQLINALADIAELIGGRNRPHGHRFFGGIADHHARQFFRDGLAELIRPRIRHQDSTNSSAF